MEHVIIHMFTISQTVSVRSLYVIQYSIQLLPMMLLNTTCKVGILFHCMRNIWSCKYSEVNYVPYQFTISILNLLYLLWWQFHPFYIFHNWQRYGFILGINLHNMFQHFIQVRSLCHVYSCSVINNGSTKKPHQLCRCIHVREPYCTWRCQTASGSSTVSKYMQLRVRRG